MALRRTTMKAFVKESKKYADGRHPGLMRLTEAAEYCGVSRQTVHAALQRGEITGTEVIGHGGKVAFLLLDELSVKAYAEQRAAVAALYRSA